MKKLQWICLGCICGGVALLSVGLIAGAYEGQTVENTYTVAESFSKISVSSGVGNVTVAQATDGVSKVVCREKENLQYSVAVTESVLTVQLRNERKWYQWMDLSGLEGIGATVYLPTATYEQLRIETGSGSIRLESGTSFATANLDSGSGKILLQNSTATTLFAESESGGVEIEGLTATAVTVETSSGSMKIADAKCDSLLASTVSGRLELSEVRCATVQAETSSGKVEMNDTVSTGKTAVKTYSGGVELNRCDAAEYEIKTSSGSVSGSLRTPKIFMAQSSSGSIRVPQTTTGGVCKVTTASGSIRLTVLE